MKFSAEVYARIDPAYELMDDGMVRHRETGVIRPKFYSGEPIPFKVGQTVKVVDGSWQFPVGTEYTVDSIEGDVVYVRDATKIQAACWERFDLVK